MPEDILKRETSLFKKYPNIEWAKIMKLRDIISHHYDQIDYEIIFDICKNHLTNLRYAIQKISEKIGSQRITKRY